MNEHPSPESILQVGLGFWPSKVLLSAVEMELFTDLAKVRSPWKAYRAGSDLHPRAARDFLDALVALGFLLRAGGGYSNTPATDLFLDKQQALLHRRHPRDGQPSPVPFWGHLTEALRTGLPQNEAQSGDVPIFRSSLRGSGAAQSVSGSDDRHQPWRQSGHRPEVSLGRTTRPSPTSARRKAILRCRSRWPIRICRASASTCPRSGPSSRNMSSDNGIADRLRFVSRQTSSSSRFPKADVF